MRRACLAALACAGALLLAPVAHAGDSAPVALGALAIVAALVGCVVG